MGGCLNIPSARPLIKLLPHQVEKLFSADFITQRADRMLQHCLNGDTNFIIQWDRLDPLANFVGTIIKKNYPSLEIPLHSRWRHFYPNHINRSQILFDESLFKNKTEQIKSLMDLAIISVLLDAGAGSEWKYKDPEGEAFFRSEGLAIASLTMFLEGFFSKDYKKPWQVNAEKLSRLTLEETTLSFQVSQQNPIIGMTDRHLLLSQLAKVLSSQSQYFMTSRPGDLYDYIITNFGRTICAADLFHVILKAFSNIWPTHYLAVIENEDTSKSINLGDIWPYSPWVLSQEDFYGLIPFHKLSLWMMFSLIEPLQLGGIKVVNLSEIPGLAEYRNGGLFIDSGVLIFKDPELKKLSFAVSDEVIVEWRALTLALLNQLAITMRYNLQLTVQQLPIVKLLQGGTWEAGRQLAYEVRKDGSSPIKVEMDASVF